MKISCLSGILLLRPDNYEKFLRQIEENIDSADREMKQRAEATLRTIADNYRRLLSERMARELDMVDASESTCNFAASNHHRVLAEVYKSMLDGEPVTVTKEGL